MERTDPAKANRAGHSFARLTIGAAAAALLGSSAGAALRPEPPERAAPAAPQQIFLSDIDLAAAERSARGWPARPAG